MTCKIGVVVPYVVLLPAPLCPLSGPHMSDHLNMPVIISVGRGRGEKAAYRGSGTQKEAVGGLLGLVWRAEQSLPWG